MKNKRHLLIGNQIIQGPTAIFPADSGRSWLEKDISIYVRYFGDNRIQHISLWSDSTMNKEVDFLKPIIRFVHWEKQNDLEKSGRNIEIDWPDIRIFLGHIKSDKFKELNSLLIEVQESLTKIQFAPRGINLSRDVVPIDRSDLSVDFELWVRNGVQALGYYSPLIANDNFSKKVLDLKYLMLASMDEFDFSGWKERYNSPFETSSFDWDYKKTNAL